MEHALVSTHICAGGMFQYRPGTLAYGHKFQLIYVRGMFFLVCLRWSQVGLVSTHICAGNVSGATVRAGCRGVSTYICAGNVSG